MRGLYIECYCSSFMIWIRASLRTGQRDATVVYMSKICKAGQSDAKLLATFDNPHLPVLLCLAYTYIRCRWCMYMALFLQGKPVSGPLPHMLQLPSNALQW